jgi:hypothetical protein
MAAPYVRTKKKRDWNSLDKFTQQNQVNELTANPVPALSPAERHKKHRKKFCMIKYYAYSE